MILCPNAKINLGLEVVGRREDGYHDIETLFVPVPELSDVLEVVKAVEPGMTCYGIPCDVPVEKNLCFKAFRLMQERYGIGDAHIFLYKNLPMGAGLGGGSSDAAFTLVALNAVFGLGLSQETLAELAAELGSDCPFFIYNRPMFASGRGEKLEPYPLDLSGYRIEVVTPGIHISTAEAYAGVDAVKGLDSPGAGQSESRFARRSISQKEKSDAEQSLLAAEKPGANCSETASLRARENIEPLFPAQSCFSAGRAGLKERLSADISKWRENVVNDFEAYAFAKYPILAEIKQSLYDRGAVYASMTGSGSAIYGIFPK